MNVYTDGVKGLAKQLESNKAIKKAFNTLGNGAIDLWNTAAISSKGLGVGNAFRTVYQNANGNYDIGRIAASGFVAGAGLRLATGGGLYRDSNGSQDIIGIPGI